MKALNKYCTLIALIIIGSCGEKEVAEDTLFQLMDEGSTGISFQNDLTFDDDFNIYTYRNFFNGGGVAIGDINNDGLSDIYFTANLEPNKLYLNKGNFQFEDITEKAGVSGSRGWSTGVTMADINGDGLLDLYVCNSGDISGDDKQNELFINNGDLTFSEKAESVGLADEGLSTHATFFDYDRDGDLDVYVLNNSFRAIGSFNLKKNERPKRNAQGGDKLYRNDNGKFVDVSEEAGIYGSVIGFGLGVMVSDLNLDGWMDLYVCNDFFERDYIYFNQGDGTFKEDLVNQMQSISMASMGVDASDLNGDGFPEVFVTEMLPKDEARLKTSMTFENWDKYNYTLENGYHRQFTRNMLHVNQGLANNGKTIFSEQGRQSQVEATDWSWGALIADYNLDGNKDIYITNGIYQNILNQDYLRYISNEAVVKSMVTEEGVNYKKLVDLIPVEPISNVAFSGRGDMSFADSTKSWGLEYPGFSSGVAYGDLDNDGDLDLVVSNVNMPAFVYQNTANKFNNPYLKIKLKGAGENSQALGAFVSVIQKGQKRHAEQIFVRGFQSTVDHVLTFGLSSNESIDSVIVRWPDGKSSTHLGIQPNQTLVIDESELSDKREIKVKPSNVSPIKFIGNQEVIPEDMRHKENLFDDFDKDGLVFQMKSTEGPKMTIGDVNGDGLEDIYLCGAKDQPGKLFLQNRSGELSYKALEVFSKDSRCEDVDALFFDADGDHDLDLYVVSGGNEYPSSSSALSDRLYLNNGKGDFTKTDQLLPTNRFESTSSVAKADYDLDGDQDLFVGVRLKDRMLGIPQNGYILENDGAGIFKNISAELAPALEGIGMIKDAVWSDFNADGRPDLVIVGEWMSVEVFENRPTGFERVTESMGLSGFKGWWNVIESADLDQDGDLDYVVGNHGLNSRLRATAEKPITCYVNDFDNNGTLEQVLCSYNGEESFPLILRHDLTKQIPILKKKYLKYENYKFQKINDIFSQEQIESSTLLEASFLESVVLLNEGGSFRVVSLPAEAQISTTHAIHIQDLNQDDIPDLILAGNLFEVKPEIGRFDASLGTCLLGKGDGTFEVLPNAATELTIVGQVRDIKPIKLGSKNMLLFALNDEKVQGLELVFTGEKE